MKSLENIRTVVAICSTTGPQSGKSTYLKNEVLSIESGAEYLRFSDPIVSFLCDGLYGLHGKTRDDYENLKNTVLLPSQKHARAITGRDFMIAAGEALRKELRPSFYSDILMERLKRSTSTGLVVVDDLRKKPELLALVNSSHKILIVNVLHPEKGQVDNDCEFNRTSLESAAKRHENHVSYLEVTWDVSRPGRFIRKSDDKV